MYRLTIDMQPDLRDGRTSRISANSPNKKNLGMRASKAKSVQRGSEPKVQISVAKSERKKVSCQDEESCTARSGSGNWMGTLFVSHLWKALHAACTHVAISEGLLREFREDAAGRDP